MKEREVRASYTDETIIVYQAYRKAIALPAVENQRFVSPFKLERMTWIKPSFLWMMYRAGWAAKEGQEHILAIEITREGWEWALRNACLSHFNSTVHDSHDDWKSRVSEAPVRIQWDPERDLHLEKLDGRSIQVGLSGEAVERYVNNWIVSVKDITANCKQIKLLIDDNRLDEAKDLMPDEQPYPVPDDIVKNINITR